MIKCFVAYAGEDFSECLKTGQYLLNQKWNEIQKSLTMILTLFSPSQSQDKLQTKYNQLKVSSSMFQRLQPKWTVYVGPIDRPLSSTLEIQPNYKSESSISPIITETF